MPKPPLPDDVRDFLAQPHPAVVTTLRSDGQPVSVATWYLLDGDRLLVNMDATRKRVEHLRRDPRVALTVTDKDDWYTHLSVVGRVVEMTDDEGLADINRLSQHYRGQDYPDQESPRISAWVEVERYHGWGGQKQPDQG